MFTHFLCPKCGFDKVHPADHAVDTRCPQCLNADGHTEHMAQRPAAEHDRPKGHDARQARRSI